MAVAIGVEQLYPSPLRYPGGKRKLASFIKLFMLKNELVGSEYAEPYAGGASVALALLFEEYASHIHINDLNRSVAAFWRAVLSHPTELCARIQHVTVSVKEWHRQRAVLDQAHTTDLDLGFATLFLNRTSRSGIIGGGVIGGFEQTGRWKIDARFNRADLIRRIRKIARHRTRITVTCIDAAEYMRTRLPAIQPGFVYLDPPYYVKGSGLYQDSYTKADHAEIAKLVRTLEQPWIVSYDAAPEIQRLYDEYLAVAYDLSYSAQARYRGTEVMYVRPGLAFPEVVSPANVTWKTVDQVRLAQATEPKRASGSFG